MKHSLTTLTRKTLLVAMISTLTLFGTIHTAAAANYMPDETAAHEGTWLQWPHHYTYGTTYRNQLDATWVAMTQALVQSEKVHIIAYNATEQKRIQNLLTMAGVPLGSVNFILSKTDDVWVRDNGGIFVFDQNHSLKITDWGFNGWGQDTKYTLDNVIPSAMQASTGIPRIDLNSTVLEGGAIEIDGKGTLMATRSSILEAKRNPNLTQAQLETTLRAQLGVSKFIWLNGAPGGKDDITDMHIDGFARFGTPETIVTMSAADLSYWGLSSADISTLYAASNATGARYNFLTLPLTAKDVVTTAGKNLGFKGSYANYYVGNTVVLVPEYKDANDSVAKAKLQSLYPTRSIVGVDVRNLYQNGGMIHCVTQQQPSAY
jgi:agmatine deiminase